jgi:eukaryotic-like serine/threonine-protein kinase
MKTPDEVTQRLFAEALDLPREERSGFLEEACRGAPEMRQVVEDLLAENDRLSGFLSHSPYAKLDTGTAAGTTASGALRSLGQGMRLGRYSIVEPLGAGGMGVVYRARDEKLERAVAIKMLAPGVLTGEDARRHFRREALALAKVNHPRIAAVYDVGEQDGVDFIVMELVAGESLAAKLRAGALPVKEATAIALQVAEALEEAHGQGVIHRDLKPANVMISPKGDAKVLDFGLAKMLAVGGEAALSLTETGGVLGTPLYMSPEQAQGMSLDARTDLWSLGVTYYESLAGAAPFQGGSSLALLRAITEETFPPLRGVRADAPLLAQHIVERALEKDPELRYQHARDFATDLRRVMRDLEPGRTTVGEDRGTSGTRRRGLKKTAAIAGAFLVGAAALVYWLRPQIPAPHATRVTQLTHDETTKVTPIGASGVPGGERLLTDGPRLYYEVASGPSKLMQVSTAGGESEEMRIPLNDHAAVDLRAATSELLTLGDPLNATLDAGGVWHMTLPGGELRRIGSFQARDAGWSPDGGSIYWAGGPEISETRVDGGDTRRILTVKGRSPGNTAISDFRVSPDRTRIRLTVVAAGSPNAAIWEAHSDGRDLRPMFSAGDGMGRTCCGTWTADGKYYVFQSDRGENWNVWAIRERQHWWEKTDGKPVRLTLGPMSSQLPSPSLDGKRIFFVGTAHRSEPVRYDVRKQDFASILPGISADAVVYNRDGSRMAYVAVPDGTLWQSKADGSDRHQLTFAPMVAALPRWSPDGKRIAFMGQEPGKPWRIYLMPVGGDYPAQVTEGEVEGADPTWSPDGNSIAFGGISGSGGNMSQPIGILNLSTRQIAALPGSVGMRGVRWSPDGKFLVALGNATGFGPLMLYTFLTGAWTTLVGGVKASYPTWSNDGKCVYYYDEDLSVWRVCLADRKVQLVGKLGGNGKLFFNGGLGYSFSIAPDDSILVTRDLGADQIYGLDVELP